MAQSGEEFWALVIDGDTGTRVRGFVSLDLARAYLAAFVRNRAHMVAGESEGYTLEEFAALPDAEAIAAYFDVSDEWHHLELVTVEGSAPPDPLEGMTQAIWDGLTNARKNEVRDNRGLTQELIGLEGKQVEVTDTSGKRRRFWVGKSHGWKPCHLEIRGRKARSGHPAAGPFRNIKIIDHGPR